MTKTLTTAAAIIILALSGVGCLPQAGSANPANQAGADLGFEVSTPTLPTPLVTVPGDVVTCNVVCSGIDVMPPQRLDIANVERAECDDMGGRFDGEPHDGALGVCVGVDY